jgi:cytochrome c553
MNPSLLLPVLLAGTIADAPPRPAKLGLCVACHGEDGRSRTPAAPHIGGQNEAYLVWALTQYRQGRREGDVMSAVAGSLNAQDVEMLAAWYARQHWPAAAAAAQ